jgi:hypothetical protein
MIAVTTAPRPVATLQDSLVSLRAAGCELSPLIVEESTPPRGILRTWAHGLRRLLAAGADPLMMLQDDVTWSPGSWDRIRRELLDVISAHPNCGYASLYSSGRVRSALARAHGALLTPGWWPTGDLNIRWSGAQCYVLPRRSAELLLSDPWFREKRRHELRSLDVLVSAALNRLHRVTWTHVPSLIDHHVLGGHDNSARHLLLSHAHKARL